MPFTSSFKTLNFIRTGPQNIQPIVLLHAVGTDLTLWGPQIEALQKKHDVIAYDLPGHGLSGKLEAKPTFENFANIISEAIDNLDCGPVNLIGISFGGMVAQTISIQRPDLVRSLVLIGTACTFTQEVRTALRDRAQFVRTEGMQSLAPLSLARWFTNEFALRRPDILDSIRKILYQQDPLFHAELWDTISTLETAPGLRENSFPAMVIVGEEDASTPVSSATGLAEALKTDKLHIVQKSSHFTNLEFPDILNNLLLNFYNSVY
ncbi:alpha/beta fold hydrolase [uncultured Mucilaginibacter sp.]|uniref:alpha/beta fold hydrolase n=1 Tax=uncultured Mucilaginibacter sp. TaxID=797541 RepID=UPI002611CF0E|nr:alpha/beta fold hydrolase [uncultured Mucilaginibacter sp.]